jgi:hypothetical protein
MKYADLGSDYCTQTVKLTLTYLLMEVTLVEKLPIVQPLKNFPPFYGIQRFITVFTRALCWSLS